MTSASKVGFVGMFAVLALATALSFGAFSTAHAQEWQYEGTVWDTPGDTNGGYLGFSDAPTWGYEGTTWDETPYWNYEGTTWDSGPGAWNYEGTTWDENPSWNYEGTTWDDNNTAWNYEGTTWDNHVEDFYGENTTYEYTDEYGVKYYSEDYGYESGYSYGGQSYGGGSSYGYGGGSGGGFKVTTPSYSYPRTQSYPTPSYPAPRPQPPVYTSSGSNTHVNTNTCTHNSCNTNVNNIDNSINGSFNQNVAPITPVYTLPPQQLIQYVAPPMVGGGYCVITASPTFIQNGQPTVLSWTSNGPGMAWLSDGIGNVAPNGTLVARPNVSTNYVLTVNGPQGPRTCNVFVQVGNSVSLTQIPYTGFDLGTLGNAAYWAGMLSFALAAAYLVVYYQGGMGSFVPSFAGMVKLPKLSVAKREEETTDTLAAPSMFTNKVVAREIAPVKAVAREIDNLPVARSVKAPQDAMTFEDGKIVVARN